MKIPAWQITAKRHPVKRKAEGSVVDQIAHDVENNSKINGGVWRKGKLVARVAVHE